MNPKAAIFAIATIFIGCGASQTQPASPESSSTAAASQPDVAKAKNHLREHIKYPATRAQILAACADTPEFTAAEKQWFSDHLPDGTYASADDVMKALGM